MNCPRCTHFTGVKMKRIDWDKDLIEFNCLFCNDYEFVVLGKYKKSSKDSWWTDE